jgi:hypothetical protein
VIYWLSAFKRHLRVTIRNKKITSSDGRSPPTAAGIWAEWAPAAASRDGALCGRSGFPRGGRTAGLALPPCVRLLLLCSLRRCASSCCALCVGVPVLVPVLVPVPAPVSVRRSYTYVHLYLCRSACVALPMYIYLYLYTCICADVSVSTHLLCTYTPVPIHLYLCTSACSHTPVSMYLRLYLRCCLCLGTYFDVSVYMFICIYRVHSRIYST